LSCTRMERCNLWVINPGIMPCQPTACPLLPSRCRFLARGRRAVVARDLRYSGDLVVRHRQLGQGLAPRRCVYCSASRVGAGAGRSARDPAVGSITSARRVRPAPVPVRPAGRPRARWRKWAAPDHAGTRRRHRIPRLCRSYGAGRPGSSATDPRILTRGFVPRRGEARRGCGVAVADADADC